MPAKKTKSSAAKKSRTASATSQPMTKANQLTVVIICDLFVLVGIFLVYKSFAAAVGIN